MYQNYSLTTWLAGLTEKQQRPRFTQNSKMEGHSSSPIKMKAAKTAGCCSLPWYLNMHERWWHLTASRHPPYKNSTHSELERERKKKTHEISSQTKVWSETIRGKKFTVHSSTLWKRNQFHSWSTHAWLQPRWAIRNVTQWRLQMVYIQWSKSTRNESILDYARVVN